MGVRAGYWIAERLDTELLYKIIYVFLFISGVKLLFDGLARSAI
jgi:uncharacterized membrane protein YfcA